MSKEKILKELKKGDKVVVIRKGIVKGKVINEREEFEFLRIERGNSIKLRDGQGYLDNMPCQVYGNIVDNIKLGSAFLYPNKLKEIDSKIRNGIDIEYITMVKEKDVKEYEKKMDEMIKEYIKDIYNYLISLVG